MAVKPEIRGAVAPAAARRKSSLPALAWAGIVGPILFTVVFWHRGVTARRVRSVAEPVSALEVARTDGSSS
jgi:hypothetical protein